MTGQVIQQGTALNAENLNHIEDALAEHDETLGKRLPVAGGTMEGGIDMGGNAVKGLKAPSAGTDAVTKDYVDGKRHTFTATLGTAWTGSGPYTQTVSLSGILASDMPHVTPVLYVDSYIAERAENWQKISMAEAVAGGIKFTCFEEKPTMELKIQIEVVR